MKFFLAVAIIGSNRLALFPLRENGRENGNREKGAIMRSGNSAWVEKGGEERDQNGPKNKNCFKFKNDYIKYDAKNLKMKNVVQLVNLFITEFSASS
jgi:hypothetical protein